MNNPAVLLLLLITHVSHTKKLLLNRGEPANRGDDDGAQKEAIPQIRPRIYNGDEAVENEFPFMALVIVTVSYDTHEEPVSQWMCGGSILNETVVLTAAHCVVDEDYTTYLSYNEPFLPIAVEVYVGNHHMYSTDPTEVMHYCKGVIVHPDYDSYQIQNDIALIILEDPIEFNDNVQPINLPRDEDAESLYAANAPISVIGWGTTESGYVSDTLQKLDYVVTGLDACYDTYGGNQLLPGMMCTGAPPMDERSGGGDSGGPLFTEVDGVWTVLGLVSWGPYYVESTSYDVNTDVFYYKSWIQDTMNSAPFQLGEILVAYDYSYSRSVGLTNLMYKVITIKPANPGLYARIDFTDGSVSLNDVVMIYDGDNTRTDTMLATVSGDLGSEGQTYVATTTRGLTLAVRTDDHVVTGAGFTFTYQQVYTAGVAPEELECPEGYWGCSDQRFCVRGKWKCDGYPTGSDDNDSAQCVDASDESSETCSGESASCSYWVDWASSCTYQQFDCQDVCVRTGEYECYCSSGGLCQGSGFEVHLQECTECNEYSAYTEIGTLSSRTATPEVVILEVVVLEVSPKNCYWSVSWDEGCFFLSWLGTNICMQTGSYTCSCGRGNCQDLDTEVLAKRECDVSECGGVSQCVDEGDGDGDGDGDDGGDKGGDKGDSECLDGKYLYAPEYSIAINHAGCGWYYCSFDECRLETQGTEELCMQRSTLVCRCENGEKCTHGQVLDNIAECYKWKCSVDCEGCDD